MGSFQTRDGTAESASAEPGREPPDDVGLAGIELAEGKVFNRRRFMSYASRVGIVLAAVPGALVGWTPSAEAISNCAPGTQHTVTTNRCRTSCIGTCSRYFSYCSCNRVHPGVCFQACNCLAYCSPARAVVVCSNWRGTGCCQYC
jgi:hypothetical protein